MNDLASKLPRASSVLGPVPKPKPSLVIPLVVASGLFMEGLDSTVIATALPQIAHSFREPPINLTVAITSYLLSLAVFIPISGWVADRFGARNVFCAAVLLFTIGSALCGASQTLDQLVAMRVLQGMGGAMMTPVGRLIMLRSFPRAELITAMSYVTIPALVGPSIGPIVGGFFAGYLSWRWIFYINIPFGIAAILLAWRNIANFRAPVVQSFDFTGFIICGLGLALFEFALENTGRHLLGAGTVALLYLAGGSCLFAYRFHARRAANPVVDLSLFRIRTFRIGVLTGGMVRIPLGAVPFVLPLLLQLCFGYTPLASGCHTAFLAVGALLAKSATKQVLSRFGYRTVLIANSLLIGVTLIGMALFTKDMPGWLLIGYLLGMGWIRSVQFTAVNTLGYADVPPELTSKGTSIASVAQQLTMSVGVALASALLAVLSGGHTPQAWAFRIVFISFGVFALLIASAFLRLRPTDGDAVSGYHADSGHAVSDTAH